MTNLSIIEKEFKAKVGSKIALEQEGKERFRVITPFEFEDGDQFPIFLKKSNGSFILTDEGHTFMHMSYRDNIDDFTSGTRQKIIDSTLSSFEVENNDGELITRIEDEKFGDALFSFVQSLVKITDVSYLSRERVKSTFVDDFRGFFTQVVDPKRVKFDYKIENKDPEGRYTVDCLINGMTKPLFIFAIQNDAQCRDSTININTYEKWKLSFYPMAVFEDQEQINRKVLARFSDVVEKQFSGLIGKEDRIEEFVRHYSKSTK